MPYYIIACHKEGKDEASVQNMVMQNVIKDRNQVIAKCFPLGADKVSLQLIYLLIIIYINRSRKTSSKLAPWIN